jgi:DNA-binding transcriptional regulator PaaX
VKDGEAYLRLTNQGQEKISRDFPLLEFQKKKWDRKWRIVLFDISEVSRQARNSLREKLKELGFGMFQQSTYISPHDFANDLREFLRSSGLSDFVYVLEVPHDSRSIGGFRSLVQKLWHLDELNDEYLKLIEKIDHLIINDGRRDKLNKSSNENNDNDLGYNLSDSLSDNSRVSDDLRTSDSSKDEDRKNDKKSEIISGIREQYLYLVTHDPFLPEELLPDDWALPRLKAMIRKLSRKQS